MNYRHWDHYVQENLHPFLADVTGNTINEGKDILEGEPYECPMALLTVSTLHGKA